MSKRPRKPAKTKLSKLPTYILPEGETLSTPFGMWRDVQFLFVKKDSSTSDDYYNRDLSESLKTAPGGPILYDKGSMDEELTGLPGANTPMAPLLSIAESGKLDECFRACFHLDDKVVWRWPEPHERVYHRPGDGLVGMFLEHLRSRFNPRCHQFVKCLCKFQYEIPPSQLVPNAVKWIMWFLGCCNVKGYLPTFRLFHYIFTLAKSNLEPLYELRFNYDRCSFKKGGAMPVTMMSSLKG